METGGGYQGNEWNGEMPAPAVHSCSFPSQRRPARKLFGLLPIRPQERNFSSLRADKTNSIPISISSPVPCVFQKMRKNPSQMFHGIVPRRSLQPKSQQLQQLQQPQQPIPSSVASAPPPAATTLPDAPPRLRRLTPISKEFVRLPPAPLHVLLSLSQGPDFNPNY